jgi:hypothetical protein
LLRLLAEKELQQFAMSRDTLPDDTTYNRQQFFWIVQGLGGFKDLAAEIGCESAETVANLIFDSEMKETNPAERYVLVAADQLADYPARIDQFLQTELAQIAETRDYVTSLLKTMMAGELRTVLAGLSEPEENYLVTRELRRNGTREREIAKASDWVADSARGDDNGAIYDCLTRYIVTSPPRLALGRTPEDLLDKVHAEVVADTPNVRSPNCTTAYPSSIGGRFLLELVFKWTSNIIWPGTGEEIWQDVALFYLGAVATVQGYTDGNKRAARMAYAITLLRAKLPFVAPNLALQGALIRMDRSDQA